MPKRKQIASQSTGNKKRIVWLGAMALLLMTGALLFNAPRGTEYIEIQFPDGTRVHAEVADTPEKLLFGLAFREHLAADQGMLFIFDTSAPHKVWTKGFKIPVDILWLDESKHVVHMIEHAQPCSEDPCPWYGPETVNARYVLETRSGFIQRVQVASGMELTFILKM
ncbi:MAG: DUF192 domain-containing protein [Nitrospirae bacterium]|nr:MAG: DUF192 domain-containing protein [Nitrospirota bacterium]